MKAQKFYIITFLSATTLLLACKDFVKVDSPENQIGTEKVYTSDETANAALRGIYSRMMSGSFANGNSTSVTFLAGRSSDEFINHNSSTDKMQFSLNNLLPDNASLRTGLWQSAYQIIFASNSVLENLERSQQISTTLKERLGGEAKFIRAFCHFYLTNLFGEIPLVLTTDYRINSIAPANTRPQIYLQIIKDLIEAKSQLPEDYLTNERLRPNKWAATALLARVYLYNREWASAEAQASEVIAQENKYKLQSDLNHVFLSNSKEAILQFFVPTSFNQNTFEGNLFMLNAAPTVSNEMSLSSDFISAFEQGDERLTKWVGAVTNGSSRWYYPFKYKVKLGAVPLTEYSMVLRLGELFLIRAEARINLDRIDLGIADLNVLRSRARATSSISVPDPLPNLSISLDKQEALLAVEKERRIELFSEWGNRWLDLKRTNRADVILGSFKSPNWQPNDILYPIPLSDLLNNPNLKQNPGYE